MSLYDGVVTLAQDQVPVIIGFEEDGIRMSSGGAEIGEWADGEYSIDHDGDGVYTITAENETLQFEPSNPSLFAAGLGVGVVPIDEPTPSDLTDGPSAPPTPEEGTEEPGPKPLTRVVFYAIAGTTAALGLWALVSLFV